MSISLKFCYMDSPIGALLLAGNQKSLIKICFPVQGRPRDPDPEWEKDTYPFDEANKQLMEYFSGNLTVFSLSLGPEGTPFQKRVWEELQQVPYGATISYGELARKSGHPGAARAVGGAMHANPLPIVIPCHRVIGSNGSLTGFGGGLDIKKRLLTLEGVVGYE